jgi:hypothetical protein
MTLDELREFSRVEEGERYMRNEFDFRIQRVEEHGTSFHQNVSVESLITCNRAGPDETELNIDELYHFLTHPPQETETG